MKIAIIGASGFLGQNLIKHLLAKTDYQIIAISRNSNDLIVDTQYKNRIQKINASVLNQTEMDQALTDIDVAFYLVHMMGNKELDFEKAEMTAAEITGQALEKNKVKRVIYMSGLGNDSDKLSKHLSSRHQTGHIFRQYKIEVIELRASMIVGNGSTSFEIIRNLIDKYPIITLPAWAKTKTQPIGLFDVLLYLESAINLKINKHEIIEIGGQENMTYGNFIKKYAKFKNNKNIILQISLIPESFIGLFLNIFLPKKQAQVGLCMLSSLDNEMIVTNNRAFILFPDIHPKRVEDSFI